jgi:Flp pilus assembly protein TadB
VAAGALLPIDHRLEAAARKKRGSKFQPLEPTTLGWFWLILFSLALVVLGLAIWGSNILLAVFVLPFVLLLFRQARKNMRPVGSNGRRRRIRERKRGKLVRRPDHKRKRLSRVG